MLKYSLLFSFLFLSVFTNAQVNWISPSNGIHKYQSIAENKGVFYALFENNIVVSSDSFHTHTLKEIPDSIFSLLNKPRIFVMDSMSYFLSCRSPCNSAVWSLDGGKTWSTAGKEFAHFNFDQDSITASGENNWIYAFNKNAGSWQKLNRNAGLAYGSSEGFYQIHGDTLISIRYNQLTLEYGASQKKPQVGHSDHEDFRFFSGYKGFLVTEDSIYYTADGGASFINVGQNEFGYTFPGPETVVKWSYLDSLSITRDAGKNWSSHYMPLRLGHFRPVENMVIATKYGDKALLFDPYSHTFTNLVQSVTPRDFWNIGQVDADNFFLSCERDTSYLLNLPKEEVSSTYIGQLDFFDHLRFGGFRGKQGFVYGSTGGFMTSNGGYTWNGSLGEVPYFDHAHFTGEESLLGSVGKRDSTIFYRSDDNGNNWRAVHREETDWEVTALMSFDELGFLAEKDDGIFYYETHPDSVYKKKVAHSGVKAHMSRVNDSSAVILDYSWGNIYTTDRGSSWSELPAYPYAPFEGYTLRTTEKGKVLIYNEAKSTIRYCHLGDQNFTEEQLDIPSMYDVQIINDSTLLFVGSGGLILTYRPGPAFRTPDKPDDSSEVVENDTLRTVSTIKLHPNPAGDWIKIDFSPTYAAGEWQILSFSGGILKQGMLPQDYHYKIDLTGIEKGIYLLRLKQGSHQETVKMIKGR